MNYLTALTIRRQCLHKTNTAQNDSIKAANKSFKNVVKITYLKPQ